MCDIYHIDRGNLQISSENLTLSQENDAGPAFLQSDYRKSLFKINFDNQVP